MFGFTIKSSQIPGLIQFSPTRPCGRLRLIRRRDGKIVVSVRD